MGLRLFRHSKISGLDHLQVNNGKKFQWGYVFSDIVSFGLIEEPDMEEEKNVSMGLRLFRHSKRRGRGAKAKNR